MPSKRRPGVFRIPLPLPGDNLKAVNVYAVADGDRVVLIDGGWALAEAMELLAAALATIGYELARHPRLPRHPRAPRPLHAGDRAAPRVRQRVSLGEGERACLSRCAPSRPPGRRRAVRGGRGRARRAMMAGCRPGDARPDRLGVPRPLAGRRRRPAAADRTLRVIATPGHTRGHVVFHDPQHDALFAGDHVLPHITPSIGLELVRPPSPLRDYLGSLRLIRALPDAALLPAHGPATASVHERVDELLAHHEQRLTATAAAVAGGADTGFEVAHALTWTRHAGGSTTSTCSTRCWPSTRRWRTSRCWSSAGRLTAPSRRRGRATSGLTAGAAVSSERRRSDDPRRGPAARSLRPPAGCRPRP